MLVSLLEKKFRLLLVGPPGCGKTARVAAAAKAAGYRLVVVRASLSERIDFGGALVPDVKAGVTRALPLELLKELMETKEKILLFLDDLGQAPTDVQAAIMRLFDESGLSPSVVIWGATNRPQDKAGAFALCEPLRSRFGVAFNIATPTSEESASGGVFLSSWQEELDGWLDWAEQRGADPAVLAFHRASGGRHLYEWSPAADPSLKMPDFRSWETVISLLENGFDSMNILSATIGKPVAASFWAFRQLAATMPTVDEIFASPEGAMVPDTPGGLFMLVETLALATEPANADAAWRFIDRMPVTFGALASRRMHKRFKQEGVDLLSYPAAMRWHQKHKDVILAAQ